MSNKTNALVFHQQGSPSEVLHLEEISIPSMGPKDVLVEMQLASVTFADLLLIKGVYGMKPTLPMIPGHDGVGVVLEVGSKVSGIQKGQKVIAPARIGSWCQKFVANAKELIILPNRIEPKQAALLAVNPPTAWRMLHDFVKLSPGDWIIQNAANSAVGRAVIDIAAYFGWKTVNLIRDQDQTTEIIHSGGTIAITERELEERSIEEITGGQKARLGLTAVGGKGIQILSRSIENGGTIVAYGALGDTTLPIEICELIYRNLHFAGFWRTQWMQMASQNQKEELFLQINALASEGLFKAPIDAKYPLNDFKQALEHAEQPNRNGKILLSLF